MKVGELAAWLTASPHQDAVVKAEGDTQDSYEITGIRWNEEADEIVLS